MWNIFKNDWYPVWADTSTIKLQYPKGNEEFPNSYEIVYSPSRDKYKLKLGGYDPKNHPFYSVAVSKLNRYKLQESALLETFLKFMSSDRVVVIDEEGNVLPRATITTINDPKIKKQ